METIRTLWLLPILTVQVSCGSKGKDQELQKPAPEAAASEAAASVVRVNVWHAVQSAQKALDSKDTKAFAKIVSELQPGEDVVEELGRIALLRSEVKSKRLATLAILAELGAEAKIAAAALQGIAKDDDIDIRKAGVDALAKVVPQPETVTDKEGRFSSVFPGKPEKRDRKIGATDTDPVTYEYSMRKRTMAVPTSYILLYFDVPDNVLKQTKAETVVEKIRDSSVKRLKGKLLESRKLSFGQAEAGLEFHIDAPGGFHYRAKTCLVGNRVYHLGVSAERREITLSTDADRFLESFKVLD